MNKLIQMLILILPIYLQSVLGFDQMIKITRFNPNVKHSVWVNDSIIINTMNITIQQWLFNNTLLAAIMNDWAPSDSSVSLLININKQNDDSNGTNLSVDYAQYFHTGIYAVNDGQDVYTANITVYNVQLSSAEFVLHEHSNSCQAYLLINDSIDPSDIEMYRTVNSSDLIFGSTSQPNTISFEIINSSVSIAEKPVNIDIDIQYQLVNNFYNMTISKNLLVDKIIDKPNITVVGTSDNCTIEIHNQNNTDITCFRHIKYCFLINGTLLQCFISNSSDSLKINYTWNWTSVDLSIEYDIIFARYIFDFNILKCADDEFNTNNFSSPQDTVTDSYNSTTNYSDVQIF
ncbi:hypothetical protein I4U23_021090 [Adineta vaga]|nr:hypothetical protein I4U23_021090 [Adineta vaga]